MSASKERLVWMDILRGSAVLLIIVMHAATSYRRAGFNPPEWMLQLAEPFEPFRIPLLVFISGLILNQSIKKGFSRFLSGKVRAILWPYILWTIIIMITLGRAIDVGGVAQHVFGSWTVLWYLEFLFIAYLLAYALRKVPPYIIVPISAALAYVAPSDYRIDRYLILFAVFILGYWIGQHLDLFVKIAKKPSVIIATAIPTVWLALVSFSGVTIRYQPEWILWTIVSFVFVVGVALHAPMNNRVVKGLSFVGKSSIIYYVMHYPLFVLMYGAFGEAASDHRSIFIVMTIILIIFLSTIAVKLTLVHPIFMMPFRFLTKKEWNERRKNKQSIYNK